MAKLAGAKPCNLATGSVRGVCGQFIALIKKGLGETVTRTFDKKILLHTLHHM
jgi:hypothetical protein